MFEHAAERLGERGFSIRRGFCEIEELFLAVVNDLFTLSYVLSSAGLSLDLPLPNLLDPANLTLLAVPPAAVDLPNTLLLSADGGARAGVLLMPPARSLRAKGVICGVRPSKTSCSPSSSACRSDRAFVSGPGVVTK